MIQVIQRAFDVLGLLAQRPHSLGELSTATGLHKPTLHNILNSLDQVGAVRQTAGRQYITGPRLAELAGRDPWAGLTLLAREVLKGVVRELNESCNVSVLHQGERRTLIHATGGHDLIANARFGQTGPLYRAATGRVLLAHLDPDQREALIARHGWPGTQWEGIDSAGQLDAVCEVIRVEGLALVEGGGERVAMVAAPVRGHDGQVVAALGVAVPEIRFKGGYRDRVMEVVRSAAAELTDQLGLGQASAAPVRSEAVSIS